MSLDKRGRRQKWIKLLVVCFTQRRHYNRKLPVAEWRPFYITCAPVPSSYIFHTRSNHYCNNFLWHFIFLSYLVIVKIIYFGSHALVTPFSLHYTIQKLSMTFITKLLPNQCHISGLLHNIFISIPKKNLIF